MFHWNWSFGCCTTFSNFNRLIYLSSIDWYSVLNILFCEYLLFCLYYFHYFFFFGLVLMCLVLKDLMPPPSCVSAAGAVTPQSGAGKTGPSPDKMTFSAKKRFFEKEIVDSTLPAAKPGKFWNWKLNSSQFPNTVGSFDIFFFFIVFHRFKWIAFHFLFRTKIQFFKRRRS